MQYFKYNCAIDIKGVNISIVGWLRLLLTDHVTNQSHSGRPSNSVFRPSSLFNATAENGEWLCREDRDLQGC